MFADTGRIDVHHHAFSVARVCQSIAVRDQSCRYCAGGAALWCSNVHAVVWHVPVVFCCARCLRGAWQRGIDNTRTSYSYYLCTTDVLQIDLAMPCAYQVRYVPVQRYVMDRECLLEYARGPDPFRFKHESVYMYRVHVVHVHTNK